MAQAESSGKFPSNLRWKKTEHAELRKATGLKCGLAVYPVVLI